MFRNKNKRKRELLDFGNVALIRQDLLTLHDLVTQQGTELDVIAFQRIESLLDAAIRTAVRREARAKATKKVSY